MEGKKGNRWGNEEGNDRNRMSYTRMNAEEILKKINEGEELSIKRVIIEGDLDFHAYEVQPFKIKAGISIESSEVHGNINFSNTKFLEDLSFMNVNFIKNVTLINSRFNDDVNFVNCIFYSDADFSKSTFKSTLNLFRSEFRKELILYDTDYNKLLSDWHSIENILVYEEAVFRKLIRNYKNLGWYSQARECYYKYRVKHREELTSFFSLTVDYFEKILSEYGSSPLRFFNVIFLVIVIFGILFSMCGALCINSSCSNACNNPPSFSDPFLYSIIIFLGKIPTDLRAMDLFRWVAVLEAIIGWLILGLLLDTIKKIIEI